MACAVACTFATALFAFFLFILCLQLHKQPNEPGLLTAIGLMALFTFFSFYLSWRLWRRSVSQNRVTTMPTWFIQAFGICFLVGMVVVAMSGGSMKNLVEGIPIALAMIYVGRNIARRKGSRE